MQIKDNKISTLKRYIIEILGHIQTYDKNAKAVIIYKDPTGIIISDFMLKEHWQEWIQKNKHDTKEFIKDMTLFEVLCEFLMAKKYYETKKTQTAYTVILSAGRMSIGLTKKAMSEKLNIPLRTLENWESGERNPTNLNKVLEWLKICDLPLDYLSKWKG